MDPWDFRQQVMMAGGYVPILGNYDPTKGQQAAASIPSTSSIFSSSYPTTTAAPAASTATSYRYSPRTSTGKRNRYAEIMSQYEQAQPYSFTSMPLSYTGGYDATAYTPAAASVNRYADIMAQGATIGGGRGPVMPSDDGATFTEPTSQQAYNVSQFGKNIRYISPVTGLISTAYGNYLAGQVNPNYSNEGKNYTAPTGGFVSTPVSKTEAAAEGRPYGTGPVPPGISENDFYAAEAAFAQPAETQSLLNRYPAPSSDGGGSANSGAPSGGGGYSGAPSGGSDVGRSEPGSAHYAQGGHVSMMHLQGPNPAGPDDGYGALKDGEYVINDKAVKKYGIELMNAINSGKISKGKLRGLLEM